MVSYIKDGIYTSNEKEILKEFILNLGKIKGITKARNLIMSNYFNNSLLKKIITIFDETDEIPEILLNPINNMVSELFKLKMPNMVTKKIFSCYKEGKINGDDLKKVALSSPTDIEIIRFLESGKKEY